MESPVMPHDPRSRDAHQTVHRTWKSSSIGVIAPVRSSEHSLRLSGPWQWSALPAPAEDARASCSASTHGGRVRITSDTITEQHHIPHRQGKTYQVAALLLLLLPLLLLLIIIIRRELLHDRLLRKALARRLVPLTSPDP
jgi:hypothetical protein